MPIKDKYLPPRNQWVFTSSFLSAQGMWSVLFFCPNKNPVFELRFELDLDKLDVTSAETKATYAEIKNYVLKEHGLKVSTLYISQVKRKCGLEVGENYNLRNSTTAANLVSQDMAKSENARQPQCPEEKGKAIVDALKHFGMLG